MRSSLRTVTEKYPCLERKERLIVEIEEGRKGKVDRDKKRRQQSVRIQKY